MPGKTIIWVVLLSVICCCSSMSKSGIGVNWYNNISIDTAEGYFLYEVNVPKKCYTRFDQIEQSNNVIHFDSSMNKKQIEDCYTKGVFAYQYQPMIDKYITDHQKGLAQNKKNIQKFNTAVNLPIQTNDSAYLKDLYYDKNEILSYKKIYARFAYVDLGKLQQLIPVTDNYRCCYSNKMGLVNTFFIVDVLDFKVY